MNKYLFTLFALGYSSSLLAHELDRCYEENSCWIANNKTNQVVHISCEDSDHWRFHHSKFIKILNSNETASHQYCTMWGDGLGYPAPGVVSKCTINYESGKLIQFQFSSIDWGNMVEFNIENELVNVKLSPVWFDNKPPVSYIFK